MIRRELLSKIPQLKAVIFMLMFCTATAPGELRWFILESIWRRVINAGFARGTDEGVGPYTGAWLRLRETAEAAVATWDPIRRLRFLLVSGGSH
jgi:hypothetical protein